MTSLLVVYASRNGHTRRIAETIADAATGGGCGVTLHRVDDDPGAFPDGKFDRIVLGGPVYANRLVSAMVKFVDTHRQRIESLAPAFFLVLLAAATRDAASREKSLASIRARVEAQLGMSFPDMEMIAGELAYTRYAWPLRWMMRWMSVPAGGSPDMSRDHDYTDWDRVREFGASLCQEAKS